MQDLIEKLKNFNESFGIEYQNKPSNIPEKEFNLRYELMIEETNEYLDACKENNLTEIADALGDKLYILIGTIIAHGFGDKIIDIFNEIHKSNMSKLDENGKPIYREDGKVLKGNNYFKPNIEKFI